MTITAVTNDQGTQVAKMARDKGKDGQTITIGTPLIPPPGCRIHILSVPVIHDRDWQEAVNAAGPNTPADYNVRKVGDQYPPEGVTGEEEFILLNCPSGGSWDKAIAWAEQFGLERTAPRQVFAIGEHKPKLHRELGLNPMYVVATKECSFDGDQLACYVWWGGSEREVDLHWLSSCGHSHDWFAFRRKVVGTRNLVTVS